MKDRGSMSMRYAINESSHPIDGTVTGEEFANVFKKTLDKNFKFNLITYCESDGLEIEVFDTEEKVLARVDEFECAEEGIDYIIYYGKRMSLKISLMDVE